MAHGGQGGGIVWGLGMYASGSTWLFNVAAEARRGARARSAADKPFVTKADSLGDIRPARSLLLVKSHETDPEAEAALRRRPG